MAEFRPPELEADGGWRGLIGGGRAPALALVLLGCWVVAADSLVTATIMPSVGESLDAFAWFGWAGSGFMVGLVVAGASAGWLAEAIGLRSAMILAGTVFAAGCAMSAAAPDIFWFLAGRVLQGCAAGWLCGLIYVALAAMFEPRHLPRVFALATSVWGIATFVGPLVGGLFADAGMWRGVFWLFAGQALLLAAASWWLVPAATARRSGQRLALGPLALLAIGIGAVATAAVVESGSALLVATGALLLVAALALDRRAESPILPLRSRPGFPLGAAYAAYFATTAAGTAFALYAPAMLQFSAGLSALEAGYLVAGEALAWTAAALIVAGSPESSRPRLIVAGAGAILAGAVAIPPAIAGAGPAAVAAAGALLGAGFGMSYSFISQRVIGAFGDAERARGSAAIAAVRNAGGALGAAAAGIAANAAGFADGLKADNLVLVAWSALGISIPFALAGVVAAIRLTRGPTTPAQAGLGPPIRESA